RHHVSLSHAIFGLNKDFSVTSLDSTVAHNTVNFRYNSWIRWVPCFKEFCYPWKTTGNVSGLTHRTWDFHQNLPGPNLLTRLYRKVRSNRYVIRLGFITMMHQHSRVLGLIF